MSSEKFYQVALSLIPGIGNVLTKQLVSYCGSAKDIFKSNKNKLSKIPGIGEKIAASIIGNEPFSVAEQELKRSEKHGIKILFYTDAEYPSRLKQIADAPPLLYCKGNFDFNAQKTLAIVGTRKATEYGKEAIEQLMPGIAKHNPLIVSGLAYGIDIYAHRSALKHKIPTIGVLASGLNVIYPAVHKDTATYMLEHGGLVSENRLDTKPDYHKFPERNRIIAGLADATIVIEAANKGGALITATLATSYKRKLLAVPGNISNPYSEGCNELIKAGRAEILTKIEDLERIMDWKTDGKVENKEAHVPKDLSKEEHQLVEVLSNNNNELVIDELSWKSQVPVGKLASLLLQMEFKGYIKSLPGKRFRLNKA